MNSSRIQFRAGTNRAGTNLYDISFGKFPRLPSDGYMCEIRTVNPDGRVNFCNDGLVSCGVAYRNPMDRPNDEVGRKLALTRAINIFPQSVRAEAWKAYFMRNDGAALRKHKYNMKSFV